MTGVSVAGVVFGVVMTGDVIISSSSLLCSGASSVCDQRMNNNHWGG